MTEAPGDTRPDDRRARRNVAVLVAAQAVLGAQVTMVFVIGGLAGDVLAPLHCLATLPITMIVLGAALSAAPLSSFMARHGRVPGFLLGALGGLLGSGLAALALAWGSFALFLLGSFLTGSYMAAQGFYRFAATDAASEAFRPKAISWVLAGGLLAALTGPQLVKLTDGLTVVPFAGAYLVAMGINLGGAGLFLLLDLPRPRLAPARGGPSWGALLRRPTILVAVACATVAYALMNLVMTSTPLAIVGHGLGQGAAADVISAHVVAMFLPSFLTGHLVARVGPPRTILAGLAILAGAGVVNLAGLQLLHFFAGLVLLGLGWNLAFIGATALLAAGHAPEERGRVQGMNDAVVNGGVAVASLASGGLMNCAGAGVAQGWQLVNMAMAPFLLLAVFSLAWLWRHRVTSGA